VKLAEREILEPPLEVLRVNADLDSRPRRVDQPCDVVEKGELFEGFHPMSFRRALCVVTNGTVDGVSDDDDELNALAHLVDLGGDFARDEVRRRLFHRQLAVQRRRHQLSVPLEAFVVVSVEEVGLWSGRPDVRVEAEEFEEGASSALLHPDDDRLG